MFLQDLFGLLFLHVVCHIRILLDFDAGEAHHSLVVGYGADELFNAFGHAGFWLALGWYDSCSSYHPVLSGWWLYLGNSDHATTHLWYWDHSVAHLWNTNHPIPLHLWKHLTLSFHVLWEVPADGSLETRLAWSLVEACHFCIASTTSRVVVVGAF